MCGQWAVDDIPDNYFFLIKILLQIITKVFLCELDVLEILRIDSSLSK